MRKATIIFTIKTHATYLNEDESLLLVTDGIAEATNSQGEYFGQDRLVTFLQRTAGPPWGSKLLDKVNYWQKGSGPYDDLTVLEIWVNGKTDGGPYVG